MGPSGPLNSIGVIVSKDGTTQFNSTGVSVVRNNVGNYTISWPAGTFSTPTVLTTCNPLGDRYLASSNTNLSTFITLQWADGGGAADTLFRCVVTQVRQ